ncbi:MAG: alanine--glyoxylate aminotransferase family protein, partial [Terriglobales bacterium]
EMTRAGARALGLKLYASVPSNALTAIAAPDGLESGVIVKAFRDNFGAVVAAGQGDVMKSALFRIAHLGYYDYLDTIGIIAALEQVMARIRPVEFGAAVAAAQKVYADKTSSKRANIAG